MKFILVCLSPIFLLILAFLVRFIIISIRGEKIPQSNYAYDKPPNIFIRIYWLFPKAYFTDLVNADPDEFKDYGVHLICGEQGSGKTITLAYLLRRYQNRYPQVKVRTNFFYKEQNGAIKSWKDLVFKTNGIYGEIDVLDEIQNWFSSLQSKDFPPDMLQEITQQRKQRKIIVGTAQVFTRVSKPIREQVNFLYLPTTFFGCLTVVRVYKPSFSDDGTIKKTKMRKMFFFVHDEELRDSFDTYHKVEMLGHSGFKPEAPQSTQPDPIIHVVDKKSPLSGFKTKTRSNI